jgi:hypothetical protein
MAVTYPSSYVITSTGALIIPAMAAAPLSVAMLNSNAAFELHNPSPLTVVYTADVGLTRSASFRLPVSPSDDGISYNFHHVVRTGTGATAVTITIEEQSGGGGWSTVYGPTATAAAASSTVAITTAATLSGGIDEVRITYSRGADVTSYDSVTILPNATGPVAIQASGFWPYDDGLLTATGAGINTELVNRPLRNARAIVNSRAQCVLSFAQEDDGTPANCRYDLTGSTVTPASQPQEFGVVTAALPFAADLTEINLSVIATVSGGVNSNAIRIRTQGGGAVSFDADGSVVRSSLLVKVTNPGKFNAYATFILEGLANSGRETYLHAVTGTYAPTETTTLLLGSVAPPASIETLATVVRSAENLLLRPWAQPALFFEGNTTGMTTRRWTCSVPPATQRMYMGVSRAASANNNGAAQVDTTIATTNTSGVPASPATAIVTVDCSTYGAEGYLDIDGSELVAVTAWSSDSYDPSPAPALTANRQLTPNELLAPALEVIEVTTTVGASMHYARLRSPADYQEI